MVDFRNTLIVMTSNLGSEYMTGLGDGEDVGSVREDVMGVVKASFRPEFLNRVDDIILFHRLQRANMAGIVRIQLKRLEALLADRRIEMLLDDEAVEWLAEKGYDPAYGARPLKRVIQTELQDQLAEEILLGNIHDGMQVKVTVSADRLHLKGKMIGTAAQKDAA